MTLKLLCSDFLGNSPLLKHLGEAGLLHDVSALLARARSRDEGNLQKIQTQAKGASLLKYKLYLSYRSSNVSYIGSYLPLQVKVCLAFDCFCTMYS